MPTSMYQDIVAGGVQDRGTLGTAFVIPQKHCDVLPNGGQPWDVTISIQVAFIAAGWTLVFCDHNVLISFHLMALKAQVPRSAIMVGEPVSDICTSISVGDWEACPCLTASSILIYGRWVMVQTSQRSLSQLCYLQEPGCMYIFHEYWLSSS